MSAADVSSAEWPAACDFAKWIEDNKHCLQPPVCNKLLYGGQEKVMVVGGSNANDREDYHIEAGEEIFYQLKGRMVVRIMEQGKPKDVEIEEGEIFVLPKLIPHSPQRFPDTMGLVLERERRQSEWDGLRWHTHDGTNRILYQEWFYCHDLGVQLKPAIERFKASEPRRTDVPDKDYEAEEREGKFPITVDKETICRPAVNLREWVATHAASSPSKAAVLSGPGSIDPCLSGFEYSTTLVTGPQPEWEAAPAGKVIEGGEVFLYNLQGSVKVTLHRQADAQSRETVLGAEHVLIIPGGSVYSAQIRFEEGCLAMLVTNSALDKMTKGE